MALMCDDDVKSTSASVNSLHTYTSTSALTSTLSSCNHSDHLPNACPKVLSPHHPPYSPLPPMKTLLNHQPEPLVPLIRTTARDLHQSPPVPHCPCHQAIPPRQHAHPMPRVPLPSIYISSISRILQFAYLIDKNAGRRAVSHGTWRRQLFVRALCSVTKEGRMLCSWSERAAVRR